MTVNHDVAGSSPAGGANEKPEAIASGFFVGSLCRSSINNIITNIHALTTVELSEVGRRPSKTTECCFATGDCENKETRSRASAGARIDYIFGSKHDWSISYHPPTPPMLRIRSLAVSRWGEKEMRSMRFHFLVLRFGVESKLTVDWLNFKICYNYYIKLL